jgi:hypothetical protein
VTDTIHTESIAEDIEESVETASSQRLEADLNYSDDFTSSSASSEVTASEKNHVIRTTLLAKPKQPVEAADEAAVRPPESEPDQVPLEARKESRVRSQESLVDSISDALFNQLIAEAAQPFRKSGKARETKPVTRPAPPPAAEKVPDRGIGSIGSGVPVALSPRHRFHKTPFRPKTFRINFHSLILDKHAPKCIIYLSIMDNTLLILRHFIDI